jgi:hypothetical protein
LWSVGTACRRVSPTASAHSNRQLVGENHQR